MSDFEPCERMEAQPMIDTGDSCVYRIGAKGTNKQNKDGVYAVPNVRKMSNFLTKYIKTIIIPKLLFICHTVLSSFLKTFIFPEIWLWLQSCCRIRNYKFY